MVMAERPPLLWKSGSVFHGRIFWEHSILHLDSSAATWLPLAPGWEVLLVPHGRLLAVYPTPGEKACWKGPIPPLPCHDSALWNSGLPCELSASVVAAPVVGPWLWVRAVHSALVDMMGPVSVQIYLSEEWPVLPLNSGGIMLMMILFFSCGQGISSSPSSTN